MCASSPLPPTDIACTIIGGCANYNGRPMSCYVPFGSTSGVCRWADGQSCSSGSQCKSQFCNAQCQCQSSGFSCPYYGATASYSLQYTTCISSYTEPPTGQFPCAGLNEQQCCALAATNCRNANIPVPPFSTPIRANITTTVSNGQDLYCNNRPERPAMFVGCNYV